MSRVGSHHWQWLWSRLAAPNLRDLIPDDLRWSWCINNGNKVIQAHYIYCNALESSQNHLPDCSRCKNCLLWNQLLVPKRLRTAGVESHGEHWIMTLNHRSRGKYRIGLLSLHLPHFGPPVNLEPWVFLCKDPSSNLHCRSLTLNLRPAAP